MKKYILLLVIIIPVYVLITGSGNKIFNRCSMLDIRDSHHDFSGAAWSEGKICRPCHIPHDANTDITNSPLWNHENTVATFELFSSPSMDGVPGQPTGRTKLCLSCHDGTVAIENHSGNTGGTRFATFGNLTTDLSNDHPVNFIYDTQLAQLDGGLYDPSITPSGLGGTIEEDLLEDGQISCISCHDVHVSRNTEGCSGCHSLHPMATKTLSLKIPMEGSQLCLTCHIR